MAVEAYRFALEFSKSTVELRGFSFVLLLVCSAFGLSWIALRFHALLGPKYVRRFREAEYHGIIWRWRWKDRRVVPDSMRAFCVKDGVELKITASATQMVYRGNTGFMRPDTDIYCTGCNRTQTISNCDDLADRVLRSVEADAMTNKWKAARERVPKALRDALR